METTRVEEDSILPPTYRLTRWLFLRLVGAVALVAFVSLGTQLRGLVGERGILPAAEFFERAHEALGRRAIFELPSLFWLSSSDAALLAVAVGGILASLCLVAGWLEGPAIAVAWACYLSLCVAGQTFLSFQWDALLLESLLCAVFWASWRWRSHPGNDESPAGRWLVWVLVFKLMFLSGATKLLALVNDPAFGAREGYVRRHELLAALARSNASDKVDARLQVGLDLLQAPQSPTPCKTFSDALDEIASDGVAHYGDVLQQARVPEGASDPAACEGVAARLDELRRGSPPAEGAPPPAADAQDDHEDVVASAKKPRSSARTKARAAPKPKHAAKPPATRAVDSPTAAEPPTRADPPVKAPRKTITKLDDDLRPPE
ncbi:MAG TPA: lipase maturation factor family protein [Nannocystaceae bacterium]|nr:lipase maturation factor family protein [Nannocystaceae bacterium]